MTPIDLVIQVNTNKLMLVIVYLDRRRVSDTSKSAETVNYKTPWRPPKKCKQLSTASRMNTSKEVIPGRKQIFYIEFFS